MYKCENNKCKISVYLTYDQDILNEKRMLEGPKSIFVQPRIVGDDLIPKIQTILGADINDSVKYTVALTDLTDPSLYQTSSARYMGTIYFAENVSVPRHIYAEDLLCIICDVLRIEISSHKIYGFDPIPKRGATVTNELVNQIREEVGF